MNKLIRFSLLGSLFGLSLAVAAHHEQSDHAAAAPVEVDTCPVSGEELGGMGAPVRYVHHADGQPDREVMLCCEMCIDRFKSNPARFLAKLDALEAAAREKAEGAAEDKPSEGSAHPSHS